MAAAPAGNFIIESCDDVSPFYLSSSPNRPRRTLFYDEAGNTKGTLHVSKDEFANLDDENGEKINGIFIHVPKNGFQYVVTKECPVMRSSKYTFLFPNAEPEIEGKDETIDEKSNDTSTKQDNGNYHCFGITFPSTVDDNVLNTFENELKTFCLDYREASCEVLPQDALGGTTVDGNSSLQELMVAASSLSKTLMTKTSDTINAELDKHPQIKEKIDKAKERATQAKTKLFTKLKESKLQEKFMKATRRLSQEAKSLADDLKTGDTDSVADKFDKGTAKTVEFIQLVTRKGANQIQSVKTVLIQRMPEIESNLKQEPTPSGAPLVKEEKKVNENVKQGLDKAKQSTAMVGQLGTSVVKAVAIGAGHTVKTISKQVESNETIQKHVAANPITYGNLKVIGKKTLNSYVTISNELENAALYLFSESAHATADVVEARHGKEVGQAAHDSADVAVNIVSIFRLDNELIYGTIAEATNDAPPQTQPQSSIGSNNNNAAIAAGVAASNPEVQAVVGQAVMSSLIQSGNNSGSGTGAAYGR